MRTLWLGGFTAFAMLLAFGACAATNPPPVELAVQFTPPDSRWLVPRNVPANGTAVCLIHLVDVRDTRADPRSMGSISNRMVYEADSIGWMRSGLENLQRDTRIRFADAASPANAVMNLNVEIVKAYMFSLTTEKSTNIVIRIGYDGPRGAGGTAVYRGADTVMNWSSSDSETQSSFDRAMAQLLETLDNDIVSRCGAA